MATTIVSWTGGVYSGAQTTPFVVSTTVELADGVLTVSDVPGIVDIGNAVRQHDPHAGPVLVHTVVMPAAQSGTRLVVVWSVEDAVVALTSDGNIVTRPGGAVTYTDSGVVELVLVNSRWFQLS